MCTPLSCNSPTHKAYAHLYRTFISETTNNRFVQTVSESVSKDLPEYYQDLASADEHSANNQRGSSASEPSPLPETQKPRRYRTDAFQCTLPDDTWTDQSTHTLIGPTRDGLTHRISITTVEDVGIDDPSVFAQHEREQLEAQLDGCRLLMDDPITLACGHPAHRGIYVWYPAPDRKRYHEQLYTIHDNTGYVLSAGFTPTTRKQLGPEVERVMRSFRPVDTERRNWPAA